MTERPSQPPEGQLIAAAARRRGMSARAAAAAAGISDTRWRHIVAGYQPIGDLYVPVYGPSETVARMAKAVGLTPSDLAEAGRQDAAEDLGKLEQEAERERSLPVGTGIDPLDLSSLSPEELEAVKAVIRAMRSGRGEG